MTGKPEYVIAPEGCEYYLTPGKWYAVEKLDHIPGENIEDAAVIIRDDMGEEVYSTIRKSAHLNGGNWIIPDDDADEAAQAQPTKPCVTAVRVGDVTVDCDDNPHEIAISDGSGDCIMVHRANIPALIEALKMVGTE